MHLQEEILKLKSQLKNTLLVAHHYQKDEVFDLADITGDSLELAQKCKQSDADNIVFCGVGFMGQSVKILSPKKRVYMPKVACCAMARMIDEQMFQDSVKYLNENNINVQDVVPVAYVNCSAYVKAEVGKMDGYICTSANAQKIIKKVLDAGKKVLFVPDRCLGVNTANKLKVSSCVIGDNQDPKDKDIICFNGFCSVHQVFSVDDIEFFRDKYKDILIYSHPECDPAIVDLSDFVGSTSQIIKQIKTIDKNQKVAIATEFNLVNRIRKENTYILASTKPTCPTMNETSLEDLYNILLSIKEKKKILNEVLVDEKTIKYANIALDKMINS